MFVVNLTVLTLTLENTVRSVFLLSMCFFSILPWKRNTIRRTSDISSLFFCLFLDDKSTSIFFFFAVHMKGNKKKKKWVYLRRWKNRKKQGKTQHFVTCVVCSAIPSNLWQNTNLDLLRSQLIKWYIRYFVQYPSQSVLKVVPL